MLLVSSATKSTSTNSRTNNHSWLPTKMLKRGWMGKGEMSRSCALVAPPGCWQRVTLAVSPVPAMV